MSVQERTLSTFIAAVASQLPPDDNVVTSIGRALGPNALERATGATNAHSFCNLLDQLASSCVSGSLEQRSCVVALALNKPSIDLAHTTMHIALNTRAIPGSRLPHDDTNRVVLPLMSAQLRTLWDVMQEVSALRRDRANLSPDQVDQKLRELRIRLVNVVYRYAWQKLLRRAEKRWPLVNARFRKVQSALKRGSPGLRTACTTLHDLMRRLVGALQAQSTRTSEGTAPIETAVDDLYAYIQDYPALSSSLGSPAAFLTYMEDLVNQGCPNDRLHLVRYVTKLLSLRLAHTVLFQAASSDLFELWSGRSLVVTPVDTAPSKARFQVDFDHCSLLTKLVEDHIASSAEHGGEPMTAADFIHQRIVVPLATKASARVVNVLQDDNRISILLRSHKIEFFHGLAHCECILLSFFHHNRKKARDLYLRYFGLSKLVCVPCERLLDSYNVKHQTDANDTDLKFIDEPYFARGCHRLAYIPWTIPSWGSGADSVSSMFLDRLYTLLQELLRAPQSTKTAHVSTSTIFLAPFDAKAPTGTGASAGAGMLARLIGGKGFF